MEVVSERVGSDRTESKYSDPPIGYINVRRREARPQAAIDVHQSEEEDELSKDEEPRNTQATLGEFCSTV